MMATDAGNEKSMNANWPFPRVLRLIVSVAFGLLLFAVISSWVVEMIAEKNAEPDSIAEQRSRTKIGSVKKDTVRSPEKTRDEKLADRCQYLAKERIHAKVGGKDIMDFCLWRKSIYAQYGGFDDFMANLNQVLSPLPDPKARVSETAKKRGELYENYIRASQALYAVLNEQMSSKDEFETESEYQARITKSKRETKGLEVKRDAAIDEIVALEKTCCPALLRLSMTGYYELDEALVFIPDTEWKYYAEEHQFFVKGKELEDDIASGDGLPFDDFRMETIQAFNFSLKDIRVSQFVKSGLIRYTYKLKDGAWEHPRKFKEYKMRHPFLLIRIGPSDYKVQITADRMLTLPWNHLTDQEKVSREQRVIYQVKDNPYLLSVFRDKMSPKWQKFDAEAWEKGESLFRIKTCDGCPYYDVLCATEVFADYKTETGRAEIEDVLTHFEKIGGTYYREFCKAARQAMER